MPGTRTSATQRFSTGARWLDLLASVGSAYGPNPRERLPDPTALRDWLADRGLAPRSTPTAADVESARRLREALRALALASVAGDPAPAPALRQVKASLQADTTPQPRATSGGLRLTAPANTAVALAWLAREALADLVSERADQLVACGDHDCGALYLDPTGRRRWCSAEVCGNKHRVRRSRALHRESIED